MQKRKSFLYYVSYCEVTIGADYSISACVLPMPVSATEFTRPTSFDYSNLDADTSVFVQQQTREIWVLSRRAAQDIVEIGKKLIAVKVKLKHGQFGEWLASEFAWTDRMARQFMRVAAVFKSENFSDLTFDLTALYELAAPSTPEAARSEAIARAEAGEPITYTTAKALKQKYTTPKAKPQPEAETESKLEQQPQQEEPIVSPQPSPTLSRSVQLGGKKPEIIAIRPPAKAAAAEVDNRVVTPPFSHSTIFSQPTPPPPSPDEPGLWWRLGPHLLCCDEPNSVIFQRRLTQKVNLLLAFPPTHGWFPTIRAEAYYISHQYLPAGKNLDQLDENLESNILFHSNLKDLVVSCFLPSIDILYIINRSERRGLIAEPNQKLCNVIINQWKKDGFKVERLS